LEKVNADPAVLWSNGKYEVSSTLRLRPEGSKALVAAAAPVAAAIPLLEAA
jgi:hypothetical protein